MQILFITTIFVWIFPAIRQYGNKYFYFFLILALADPISLVYGILFKNAITAAFLPIVSVLMLASIQTKDGLSKSKYLYLLIIILIPVGQVFIGGIHLAVALAVIMQLFIFVTFLKSFIQDYSINQKVNTFLLILTFYEMTVVLKYFNILLEVTDVTTSYFIITSIIQGIFGLYFSIFRASGTRLMAVGE